MEQYLIDTNVVSAYLSATLPVSGMQFLDEVINNTPNLSVITHIELLCWNTDDSAQLNVRSFIGDSVVINISSDIIELCALIRKSRKIKTPDAIIAATALASNHILITHNERDFVNIKGLRMVNPMRL